MVKSVINPRPFWITVVAILLLMSGVIGITINLFYTVRFPGLFFIPLNFFTFVGEFLLSAFFIHIASGLLFLEERARKCGVTILIIAVLFRVVILAINMTFGKPIDEVIFNAYIVIYVIFAIYLKTSKIKKAFNIKTTYNIEPRPKGPMPKNPKAKKP